MSLTNFIPTIWSARLLAGLDKALVYGNLVDRSYEGEVRFGNTLKLNRPDNITVGDYSGTVTYQSPTSTQRTLTINQQKYFAFKVDDISRVQANVDLVDAYSQRAAYALADAVDQYIASLYTAAGAGTATLDITAATPKVYEACVELGRLLDEQNVPRQGRWVVVSPKVYAALLKDTNFVRATETGQQMLLTGAVGQVAGFSVFVSNNVPVVTGATTKHKCLAGINTAIVFAGNVQEVESIRLQNEFATGVRGLYVFGAVVAEPNALAVLDVKVA